MKNLLDRGTRDIYVESVTSGSGDYVLASTVEKADDIEINAAKCIFEQTGNCTCHSNRKLIYDISAWMYDLRYCAICNRLVGLI